MKAIRASRVRPFFYSLGLTLVLYLTLVLGLYYSDDKTLAALFAGTLQNPFLPLLTLVLTFIVLYVLIYLMFTKTGRVVSRAAKLNPLKRLPLSLDKKSLFLCTAVVCICWLPWLILAYPASMGMDTLNQLWQYAGSSPTYYTTLDTYVDAEFIDHHPVFDTLVFGLFLSLGELLGSQNVGLFLFVVLQSLGASFVLVFSCCYLERLNVPKLFRLLLLIFVALFPSFAQFSATMLKDSLFVLFFVMFFLGCIEIYRTKGACLKRVRFVIVFALAISLCILTKKTGVYIVGLSAVVMLIVYRKHWWQVLVSFGAPLLVCACLFPLMLYPVLDVAPGGKQEFFSVLFQQTAAYCIQHADEVTAEEYETINAVLDADSFEELYDPEIVDPIKNSMRSDVSTEDMFAYLGVWASQGIKHPLTYLAATTQVNIKLLSPTTHIKCYRYAGAPSHHALLNEKVGDVGIDIMRPEPLASLSKAVYKAYNNIMSSSPLLTFFFSQGFWGFWVPLLCIVAAFYHNKRSLIVFVPIILSLLFLIISPAHSSRYILPFLFTAPLMIGFMLSLASAKESIYTSKRT